MIAVVFLRIAPYAGFGALMGAAYLAALGWNVRLYAAHGGGCKALLLHLSRLALAVAAFTLCARQGAAPMLASFAGFFAIRTISISRFGLVPEKNP